MRTGIITAVVFMAGMTAVNAADLDGEWARGDGNARVRIAPCGQDVCAINTWIRPGTRKEKAGDRLVMSIKPSGEGQYAGSAFDPQRNMTYKIDVSVNGNTMTTRGCIVAGLICKGINWSRIRS
jgi:uncharacterized protein (DUF2147 family)